MSVTMHIGKVAKGTKIYKGDITVMGDQANVFYAESSPTKPKLKRKSKPKMKRKLSASIVIGQITGQLVGHQTVHGSTINVFDR